MKTNPFRNIAILVSLIASALALHGDEPDRARLGNMDKRKEVSGGFAATVATEQKVAAETLKHRVPGTRAAWDPLISSPRLIVNDDGFLSGPDTEEELDPKTFAEAVAVNPNEPRNLSRQIKRFLDENADLFGHSSEILSAATFSRGYVTAHNGLRTMLWEQQLDGIPVFEAVLYGHIAKNGELVSLSSQFLPALATAADAGTPNRAVLQLTPSISAQQAVALAAGNIGEILSEAEVESIDAAEGPRKQQKHRAEVLKGEAETSFVWLPMNRESMRLCWRVVLTGKSSGELFQVLVDAESGEPQVRHCWTSYANPVAYRVFPSDNPSPFSPGWSTPTNIQPALTSPVLTNLIAISTNASPDGWIGTGRTNTIGNNVDAHTDLFADNPGFTNAPPDGNPPRPTGTTNNGVLTFDFGLDLTTNSSPSTTSNRNSAVVNAFYWCNWIHDRLYDLGFTEAAGNFQQTNFNRGGTGGDPVLVDVQDGAAVGLINNANFSTSPQDGTEARMQLGLWTTPNPDRDSAFDTEVILHEYTHFLSTRRVGQGTGLSGAQASALAEGWSDFMAMCMLSESGDDLGGAFAFGAYSTFRYVNGGSGTGEQNYHYGMRYYPYSTNMALNPMTFNDIDSFDGQAYQTVPINPSLTFNPDSMSGVGYWPGQIWGVTLWDVFANLVAKHGYAAGKEITLRLVVDGMSLCPPNPTFLEARDALLLADRVNSGGANLTELRSAFAKRGMGWSAEEPVYDPFGYGFGWSSASFYDLPPTNQVLPGWPFVTGNGVYSTPAIGADGSIYLGSSDGKLYALNPDGSEKWEYGPAASPQSFNASPVVGADGTIYARRNNGVLYAVHPDGTLKWNYTVTYDSYASPAIGQDGTIYVVGSTNLIALNPDGTLKWTAATGNTIYSSPAIGPDGSIYFGGMDGELYALNPANGATKSGWTNFAAGAAIASSPAVGSDGTVYFGSDNGKVYALNGSNGARSFGNAARATWWIHRRRSGRRARSTLALTTTKFMRSAPPTAWFCGVIRRQVMCARRQPWQRTAPCTFHRTTAGFTG